MCVHSLVCSAAFSYIDRKHVVFGKLVHGHELLAKIETVGDEDGSPTVTVKIINCGELNDSKNHGATISKFNLQSVKQNTSSVTSWESHWENSTLGKGDNGQDYPQNLINFKFSSKGLL